jgi:transposase
MIKSGNASSQRARAMVSAYRSGKSLQAVGDEFGVTRECVRQTLNRFTRDTGEAIPRHPPKRTQRECARCHKPFFPADHRYGSKYCSNKCGWAAKQLPINSAEIVAAYAAGMTYTEVGRRFGIATMSAYRLVRKLDHKVGRRRGGLNTAGAGR